MREQRLAKSPQGLFVHSIRASVASGEWSMAKCYVVAAIKRCKARTLAAASGDRSSFLCE
jgi:hypothetical protein